MEHTRPEKSQEMTKLVGTLRNAIADAGRNDGINLAEAVSALAQTISSVLVGAYNAKNREIVLMAMPDVVRAYYPLWEKIYGAHGLTVDKSPQRARTSGHVQG